MKKILALCVAAVISLSAFTCFAQEYADVKINGEKLEFDVPAQIINDRTMVPMRKIFETFGAKVTWIEEEEMIIANTTSGKIVIMKIGNKNLFVKQEKEVEFTEIEFDAAPIIINDRTLVPVRVVSEAFQYKVDWDEATSTVLITK